MQEINWCTLYYYLYCRYTMSISAIIYITIQMERHMYVNVKSNLEECRLHFLPAVAHDFGASRVQYYQDIHTQPQRWDILWLGEEIYHVIEDYP